MTDQTDREAAPAAALALLVGRIALAAIFIEGGFGKLTGIQGPGLHGFAGYLTSNGIPADYSYPLAIIAGIVEFFGGLCVLVGFMTRCAALLMAVFTVIAAFIGHRFWQADAASQYIQTIQFMKNVSIFGGFLALYAAGPGAFSVDRRGS